ncbi:MAG: protein translocase subunit SecD [Proteobacteria bacterium]|nr:protein translocase subunit SecD [Pseudomonadota bacterium]
MLHFPRWKVCLVVLVCLAGLLFSVPNFMPKEWMPTAKRANLGLDLRGGSYLLLQVGFDAYLKEQVQSLLDDVRARLRDKHVGYTGLNVINGAVEFTLRDPAQFDDAKAAIRGITWQLDIKENNGRVTVSYSEQMIEEMRRQVVGQSIEIVRKRVDETGTKEPSIARQGKDRILLQVPGLENPEHLKTILGKTAKMTFHLMDDVEPFPRTTKLAPPDSQLLRGAKSEDPNGERFYMIKKKPILSGDMLVSASAGFERGMAIVNFRFNNIGGRKFAETTQANVDKPFAIVLDDEVISAPVIREPILGGSGMISGNFTVQSANDLALLLRAGALPAPLTILEERTIGPSLGADSIKSGTFASSIGLIMTCMFMVLCYGRFGGYACLGMVINLLLILAIMSFIQATLTMPGIAGMVLTVAMGVDANVLIFERIREEQDKGKTPIAAIDQGFQHAFSTIIDSHITTLVAAFLLYAFGSGPVRGFAVTLSIGLLASLFTAVMFCRMMIILWLRRKKPSRIAI